MDSKYFYMFLAFICGCILVMSSAEFKFGQKFNYDYNLKLDKVCCTASLGNASHILCPFAGMRFVCGYDLDCRYNEMLGVITDENIMEKCK